MPSKEDSYVVIYADYFNSRLSRREGRRLPKELCRRDPKIVNLKQAARRLQWRVVKDIKEKAPYPRNWYHSAGRILLNPIQIKKVAGKHLHKTRILRQLGEMMKKDRDETKGFGKGPKGGKKKKKFRGNQ